MLADERADRNRRLCCGAAGDAPSVARRRGGEGAVPVDHAHRRHRGTPAGAMQAQVARSRRVQASAPAPTTLTAAPSLRFGAARVAAEEDVMREVHLLKSVDQYVSSKRARACVAIVC